MKYEIKTPNHYFVGERLEVKFKDGKATTDSKDKASEFINLGYTVEEIKEAHTPKAKKAKDDE